MNVSEILSMNECMNDSLKQQDTKEKGTIIIDGVHYLLVQLQLICLHVEFGGLFISQHPSNRLQNMHTIGITPYFLHFACGINCQNNISNLYSIFINNAFNSLLGYAAEQEMDGGDTSVNNT
jgi:hypothetical protein